MSQESKTEPTTAEKLWHCFAVVAKAGDEATAMLDEIEEKLKKFGVVSSGGKPKKKSGTDRRRVTRTYELRNREVLGVQVVFYSEEESKTGEQSVLNVMYGSYDEFNENYFGVGNVEEGDWKDVKLACGGRLVWFGDDNEVVEWAFSYPLHAMENPGCIDKKIIKPVKKLLSGTHPEQMEEDLLKDALQFVGEGADLKAVG